MKENLIFVCLGNGITVVDQNRISSNDNEYVAHISEDGSTISYYKILPFEAIKKIEKMAIDTYLKNHDGRILVLVKKHNILKKTFSFLIDLWSPEMINKRFQDNHHNLWSYIQLFQPFSKEVNGTSIKLGDWTDKAGNRFVVSIGDQQTDYFQNFSKALQFYNRL